MKMVNREAYSWWKHAIFWGLWLLLMAPGYCAAFGAWFIGSMLMGYHDPVDITLTAIMLFTLFLIAVIAVYTSWHFIKSTRAFGHLLLSLLVGLLGIPTLSALGTVVSLCTIGDSACQEALIGAGWL